MIETRIDSPAGTPRTGRPADGSYSFTMLSLFVLMFSRMHMLRTHSISKRAAGRVFQGSSVPSLKSIILYNHSAFVLIRIKHLESILRSSFATPARRTCIESMYTVYTQDLKKR